MCSHVTATDISVHGARRLHVQCKNPLYVFSDRKSTSVTNPAERVLKADRTPSKIPEQNDSCKYRYMPDERLGVSLGLSPIDFHMEIPHTF
jgi:hypothetical protein